MPQAAGLGSRPTRSLSGAAETGLVRGAQHRQPYLPGAAGRIVIEHRGQRYELRETRIGKFILTW